VRPLHDIFDKRTLLILGALFLLALFSQWLLSVNNGLSPSKDTVRHDPDYTMENFFITTMGATGSPEHRLQARYLAHYPDDGSTEFTAPQFTLYERDDGPWQVSAERGWVGPKQKFVVLRDNVLIENPQAASGKVMRVTTSELQVLPDDKFAQTGQPVTLQSQNSLTHAVGMRLYLNEERLQLLSKVKGTYAPKP
jgi:lipopolysaccharide export system protein LptC